MYITVAKQKDPADEAARELIQNHPIKSVGGGFPCIHSGAINKHLHDSAEKNKETELPSGRGTPEYS